MYLYKSNLPLITKTFHHFGLLSIQRYTKYRIKEQESSFNQRVVLVQSSSDAWGLYLKLCDYLKLSSFVFVWAAFPSNSSFSFSTVKALDWETKLDFIWLQLCVLSGGIFTIKSN